VEACLAIDIGGTKLAAGVVDRGGTVLATGRRATPATGSSEELFATLADLVAEVLQAVQGRPLVCGVG
jgi:glucokinase